jgi:hypothetical protein
MNRTKQLSAILLLVLLGAFIWVFKGSEAKQKWAFKIKNIYDNRRQAAENKQIARNGGVLLDDIELASYHG